MRTQINTTAVVTAKKIFFLLPENEPLRNVYKSVYLDVYSLNGERISLRWRNELKPVKYRNKYALRVDNNAPKSLADLIKGEYTAEIACDRPMPDAYIKQAHDAYVKCRLSPDADKVQEFPPKDATSPEDEWAWLWLFILAAAATALGLYHFARWIGWL